MATGLNHRSDAWGGSWGTAWAGAWGWQWRLLDAPFNTLDHAAQIHVLQLLHSVYSQDVAAEIVVLARRNDLSIFDAEASVSTALRAEGAVSLTCLLPSIAKPDRQPAPKSVGAPESAYSRSTQLQVSVLTRQSEAHSITKMTAVFVCETEDKASVMQEESN